MTAIIKNMNIPKCCGECKMSGTDVCLKWVELKRYELGSERSANCPLKSVEGLIEKISKHKQTAVSGFMYDFIAYNKGLHDAIETIKEYCEVEAEE